MQHWIPRAAWGLLVVGHSAQTPQHRRVTAVSPATREQSEREQVAHVLHRLAFGPRPGDVEAVLKSGVDRWIEAQLHPARLPESQTRAALAAYEHLDKSAAELRGEFPPPGALRRAAGGRMTPEDSQALRRRAQEGRQFVGELMSARVARAVVSERQLEELMTDFWLNHFSVFVGKNVQMRYHLSAYEREAIRPLVFGRFRDLLGAVAHSPAMLIYLDNAISVADSGRPTLVDRRVAERRVAAVRGAVSRNARRPGARLDSAGLEQLLARRPRGLNENYARELLELHTLGVDGGYSQLDVIEVARALTGWSVRAGARGGDGFVFNAVAHDAGGKSILGRPFAAGRGEDEGDRVLDLLAEHPATARHISTKLVRRFVSDSPPSALVDRVTDVFMRTKGDIRAVVRTIVTSDEFFSRAAYRAKVKSPFEVVVSAARALGARADSTPLTAGLVARMGQPIYGHQAPNGWPETGAEWMNTGAILNRINFGIAVASNRLPGVRVAEWHRYGVLAGASRAAQVDGVISGLLGGEAAAETRAILESGNNPMLDAAPGDTLDAVLDDEVQLSMRGGQAERRGRRAPPPLTGLDQIIGLALGSPEFQRR